MRLKLRAAIVVLGLSLSGFAAESKPVPSPAPVSQGVVTSEAGITHSFLATGASTRIIDAEGKTLWTYPLPTREGWVLPSGDILLAIAKCKQYPGGGIVLTTREGKTLFSFQGTQTEVNSVQALPDGYFTTEAGPNPRLIELDASGKIRLEFPLQCQKGNIHLQTRMSRKLSDGTYLVPHLLDFAVKQYDATGKVIKEISTVQDADRKVQSWPFTAIRLPSGNTLVTLTHANQVAEFDPQDKMVWNISNKDFPGNILSDPCGAQRLPNGNTVFTSYAAGPGKPRLIEVTPDKKIVWSYTDSQKAGIHSFQILDTNGQPVTDVWR